MARVTVEDCVGKIPNRFDLVMIAAQRSRDVAAGAPITVDRDNDKNPVVALREIAESTVETEIIRESLVRGLQRHVEIDSPEDEEVDISGDQSGFLSIEPVGFGEGRAQPQYNDDMADRMGMQIHSDSRGFEDANEADLALDR